MKSIDELIADLCPEGAEYKSLGDLVANGCLKMARGNVISKKDIAEHPGIFPIYSSSAENDGEFGRYGKYMFEEELVTWSIDGGGRFFYRSKAKYSVTNVCGYLRVNDKNALISKYLYFTLASQWQTKSYNYTHKALPTNIVKDYVIPLPPLAVQKEIVRILDGFTGLIDELENELAARRKQYEQYREKLLTFGDDVERKSLGEIGTSFVRGNGIKRDEVTAEGLPCVRYGEIYTKYNIGFDTCISHTTSEVAKRAKSFEHGDILFAITGEKVEDIAKCTAYLGYEKCYVGGDVVVMKHNQNPKFMAYVLSTADAQKQKSKGKTKSKVVHSSVPALKSIIVPIPPLDEQKRIVEILDKFDALCNDATAGLAAEIAARKKQYEYYRDKLLTFKKAS